MEPGPAAVKVPVSQTEPYPAPEPEPNDISYQERESTTMPITKGLLVEFEGREGSSAHTPATVAVLCLASGHLIFFFFLI